MFPPTFPQSPLSALESLSPRWTNKKSTCRGKKIRSAARSDRHLASAILTLPSTFVVSPLTVEALTASLESVLAALEEGTAPPADSLRASRIVAVPAFVLRRSTTDELSGLPESMVQFVSAGAPEHSRYVN